MQTADGIIVKLVSEAIDGLDSGPQEAALAAGGTWFAADRTAMLPAVAPSYAAQVLYTFEVNIRAFDEELAQRIIAAIERIVAGECQAAGSPQPATTDPLPTWWR